MNPIDDERYVDTVKTALDAAKAAIVGEGYTLDGLIIVLEVNSQGATIISDFEDDDRVRSMLREAADRSHGAESRTISS